MFLGIHFRFPKKYFPLGSYYRFPTVPRIPIVFSGKTKIVNGRKIWKNETFLSPGTLTNCPICMKARLMAVYKLCRLCRGGGNTPKVDLLNKPYILNKEDDKDGRRVQNCWFWDDIVYERPLARFVSNKYHQRVTLKQERNFGGRVTR